MKTLKDLTPEILAKIPEYQARAIEGVFDGGRYRKFNIENAKAAVKWNYEKCDYKTPIVLVAENPLEQQLMYNYLNVNKYLERVVDTLNHDTLKVKINGKEHEIPSYLVLYFDIEGIKPQRAKTAEGGLHRVVQGQLNDLFVKKYGFDLKNPDWDKLETEMSAICQKTPQKIDLTEEVIDLNDYSVIMRTNNNNYLFTLNVYSDSYYTWYKFIKEEFNLPLSIEKEFEECFALQRASGVFSCIFAEEVAVVCKYSLKVTQETSGLFRLHNTEGNAVEWGQSFVYCDGYYVQGRNLPEELFLKLKSGKYTVEDFAKEQDEEIKSASIAFLQETKGDDFLVSFFRDNLKEVDTFVDRKADKYLEGTTKGMNIGVYTLFKGEINGTSIAYVRCYCPSTDRMFFLGVNSTEKSAKDAIASLYRIPKVLKSHIKTINRQGERFSTNFTDKGNEILKGISKEEAADLVSISGDEYFAKMEYEF
jgi:hypothetical protein